MGKPLGNRKANPLVISKKKLLLVEGKDELGFFEVLMGKAGIDDVQVVDCGGKNNMANKFGALLLTPGFADVSAYAIVRDADENEMNAVNSLRGLLKKFDQPCPMQNGEFANSDEGPKVGIYILPGCGRAGCLEALCLETVSDHLAMPCVERFMACLEDTERHVQTENSENGYRSPKNSYKAKAQCFLSAMRDAVREIGVAAQKGYWNFEHDCLRPLKNFISQL